MAFKNILCPVDFSSCSGEALRLAAALSREWGAALVIAHVWEPSQWSVVGEFALAPGVVQDMVNAEEAELDKWGAIATDLGVRSITKLFLTGAAWDQIVTTAREDRAIDLIVIGTHGRSGIKHALLGSVAEKVVRHAPCPVLVARSREPAK